MLHTKELEKANPFLRDLPTMIVTTTLLGPVLKAAAKWSWTLRETPKGEKGIEN